MLNSSENQKAFAMEVKELQSHRINIFVEFSPAGKKKCHDIHWMEGCRMYFTGAGSESHRSFFNFRHKINFPVHYMLIMFKTL